MQSTTPPRATHATHASNEEAEGGHLYISLESFSLEVAALIEAKTRDEFEAAAHLFSYHDIVKVRNTAKRPSASALEQNVWPLVVVRLAITGRLHHLRFLERGLLDGTLATTKDVLEILLVHEPLTTRVVVTACKAFGELDETATLVEFLRLAHNINPKALFSPEHFHIPHLSGMGTDVFSVLGAVVRGCTRLSVRHLLDDDIKQKMSSDDVVAPLVFLVNEVEACPWANVVVEAITKAIEWCAFEYNLVQQQAALEKVFQSRDAAAKALPIIKWALGILNNADGDALVKRCLEEVEGTIRIFDENDAEYDNNHHLNHHLIPTSPVCFMPLEPLESCIFKL